MLPALSQLFNANTTQQPLSRLLLQRLLPAYILFATVILAVQMTFLYFDTRDNIRVTLKNLATTYSPSVAAALWEFQQPLLNSITEGISSHPSVVRVEIIDQEGQLSTAWQKSAGISVSADLVIDAPLTRMVDAQPRQLGILRIASSDQLVNLQLRRSLSMSLLFGSLQFLFLGVLLWQLVRQLAVRPLMHLSEQVESMVSEQRSGQIKYVHTDSAEINTLQTRFNQLMQQLAASHAEIAAQNISLERAISETTRDIRNKEARFRSIFEHATSGITFADAHGNLLEFNPSFVALLGYTPAELLNMNFAHFTHPDDIEQEQHYFVEIQANQRNHYRMEKRYLTQANAQVWVDLAVTTVRNEAGEISNFVGLVTDITARKTAEQELHQSKVMLIRAQEVAKLGSWHLDLKKNNLTYSDETCRIFGIPLGTQFSYEEFLNHVHPEDRQAVDTAWVSALKGSPYDFVHRILVASDTRWVREIAEFNFAADGSLASATGTVQDITERMRTSAEYEAILRAALDGFWMTDLEGHVIEVNDAYCDMIGYGRDQLLQMRIPDLEVNEQPEETHAHIMKILSTGSDRFETRHRHRDGHLIDFEISVNYLKFDKGRLIVFLRDISERKRADKELLAAKLAAEAANRAKS